MGFTAALQRPYSGPATALFLGENGIFCVKTIRLLYELLSGFGWTVFPPAGAVNNPGLPIVAQDTAGRADVCYLILIRKFADVLHIER